MESWVRPGNETIHNQCLGTDLVSSPDLVWYVYHLYKAQWSTPGVGLGLGLRLMQTYNLQCQEHITMSSCTLGNTNGKAEQKSHIMRASLILQTAEERGKHLSLHAAWVQSYTDTVDEFHVLIPT